MERKLNTLHVIYGNIKGAPRKKTNKEYQNRHGCNNPFIQFRDKGIDWESYKRIQAAKMKRKTMRAKIQNQKL